MDKEHKDKISKAHIGKKHSKETKEKMSKSHKGKELSQETKDKISETMKSQWNNGKYNKHIWKEIESNENGTPTKYQCVKCGFIYVIAKRIKKVQDYIDSKNDIINRIAENLQKINLFELLNNVRDKDIVISHLRKEIDQLRKLL